MSVTYEIFADDQLVVFRYSDALRVGEVEACFAMLITDPDYQNTLRLVADMSQLEQAELDLTRANRTTELIVHEWRNAPDPQPPIVLAPNGMARSYANMIQRVWQHHAQADLILVDTAAEALGALPQPSDRLRSQLGATAPVVK